METYYWHNDPGFKNLYEAEIGVLNRGLGGDFKLVKLYDPSIGKGRVMALGVLSFDKDKSQPIQVVFPTKYPYSPPKVVAINLKLTPEGDPVAPIQPRLFGKGNQYGDGTLCLFRNSFWDYKQHNIGWVLRRAQKWLTSVNSLEGFKPEEIVEEYTSPISHSGQILLPKDIEIPENSQTGEIILTQFKPNHYILTDNVLPNYPFQLQINKESFQWYRFKKGITFKSLFPVFDGNSVFNVFESYFGVNIVEGSQIKNVALYFPSDDNPWHFFKLIISRNEMMAQINVQYYLSRNINNELYLRTADIFSDKLLMKKRVTIVGLGALGSEVAKSLARNGVGHFNLFDNDTFEIGNSVRHAADLYYIGEDKVNVAKQLIQRSNPNITVNSFKVDVLNDAGNLEESLINSDLCIILTAEDSVDYLINDKYSRQYNIPFIYARVSAGGISGSIQIIDKSSPCLRCLRNQSLDKLPKPKEEVSFKELKPEYGSCSSPAVPGSEVDTKEIALQVSRLSLQLLLEKEESAYPKVLGKQYFWHGPFGSKEKQPFTWEINNFIKDPNCQVCR